MKKVLTVSQKKILEIIKFSLEEFGEAPTIREIMTEIKAKSPHTISHHLEHLEKLGLIIRTGEAKRNIILSQKNPKYPFKDLIRVPLVGWTVAGEAIFSEQNILDWISISSRFIKSATDDIFLLKVRGDSMIPRIEDGDIVIVRKQYTADPGQIIVALIGSDTTIKKYLPRENHIILQPENPDHEPIVVNPDDLRIQGIVQGVMKYC